LKKSLKNIVIAVAKNRDSSILCRFRVKILLIKIFLLLIKSEEVRGEGEFVFYNFNRKAKLIK
jgi:hypothetical protein